MLMSVVFPVTSLLSLPLQAWAQTAQAPAFATPKPVPAPVVHDDPAWHTIDYHAQEQDAPLSPAQAAKAAVCKPRLTLLDEVGRLTSAVDADKVAAWKHALHQPKTLSSSEAARLHVLVGEVTLAQDENPEQALWHFAQARKLSHPKEAVYGLAAYDSAIASFYEGAYAQARAEFKHILTAKPGLHGFDRADCTLFMRHASACAGYHDERAKLGIPEPLKLDPLCGAAALAQALKTHGKAYDKKHVLANMRVTGRGSNMGDILAGARKLGLSARLVSVGDKGLIALPKPLVAYVEHDHFISVIDADKQGVTYLCADCGPWPGGRVVLTWAQWHKLEATHYAVMTTPGSDIDAALAAVLSPDKARARGVQVASASGKLASGVTSRLKWMRRFKQMVGIPEPMGGLIDTCAYGPEGGHCQPQTDCSDDCMADGMMPDGASLGDPVNLATGEEEYTPPADLTVYNPVGPSVSWGRIYNSLRGYDTQNGYQSSDLGQGWSHSYNLSVVSNQLGMQGGGANARRGGNPNVTPGGNGLSGYILEPNGSRLTYSAPAPPTANTPRVVCTLSNGAPMLLECDYNSATGGLYFIITYPDRTKMVTQGGNTSTPCSQAWYPLGQMVDNNGNAVTFNYSTPAAGSYPLLTSIADKNGAALLTFNRAASGNLTSIQDRYSRSVYYHVAQYATQNVPIGLAQSLPELDHVSQIVVTGAASPPDRFVYGYQNITNGEIYNGKAETTPLLHTLTVPSPTGSGTATATINYLPNYCTVLSLVDANGNSRSYNQTDANHTQVTVKDPQNNIVYRYTAGYDMNMSQTTRTDGTVNANGSNTTPTGSSVYADPNDSYRPSQTQDGNGYAAGGANNKGTWEYTWDQYGNCTSMTTPRGTTTTNTFSYANFAFGELTGTQTGTKQATTYAYYEPSGNAHTVISPLPGTTGGNQSVTTSYTYTALGNVLTTTRPGNGTAASIVTTCGYTQDGSYTQSEALGEPLTITNNLGKTSHVRYDARANQVAVINPLGSEADAAYNIADQPTAIIYPATGQTGTGRSQWQSAILYPDGPVMGQTLYDESGNAARQTAYTYGREGETLSTLGSTETASYGYDAMYRPIVVSDGDNQQTRRAYNATGYLASVTLPDNTVEQYTSYDADGNVLQRSDGRGIVTNYVYNDPESELTDTQYPAAYNSVNVHTAYDAYGRTANSSNSVAARAFSYDDTDTPLNLSTTYTGLPARALSYGYWPNGSRSTLTTPAGTFSYSYDGNERLSGLVNPSGEAFSWTYLDNDWAWTQTSGNAVTTTFTYDAVGDITDMANRQTNANHTLLSDFGGMMYDAADNRLRCTASLSNAAYSGLTTYSVDSKDQLLQEQSARGGGYTGQFGYDGAGNTTTFKGAAQTFNAANQNTAYTYDGGGNPTAYKDVSIAYDPENRVTAIGTAWTAAYTPDSLRACKQTAAGTVYFLYDEDAKPVCEMDVNGNVTAVNTFGQGLLARRVGTASTFYAFDPQGSVSQRLDNAGNVLASYLFDAYGTRAGTDNSSDPFSGYHGQDGYYTDWETGLQLLTYRYYDPAAGRFLNRDPGGYECSLYAYSADSPITYADPSGLLHCSFDHAGQTGRLICTADPGDRIPDPTHPGGSKHAKGGEPVLNCPASNVAVHDGIPNHGKNGGYAPPGTYRFGDPLKVVTPKLKPLEGTTFIPINIPGAPGIGLHAGHGDDWQHETRGCVRTKQNCVDQLAKLIRGNPGSTIHIGPR